MAKFFLHSGHHKAKIKVSAALCSFLDLRDPLQAHMVLGRIQFLVAVELRPRFPAGCWQRPLSANRGHLQLPAIWLLPCALSCFISL